MGYFIENRKEFATNAGTRNCYVECEGMFLLSMKMRGGGGVGDFPPVCEDPAGLDCRGWPINNTVGIIPHTTHMLLYSLQYQAIALQHIPGTFESLLLYMLLNSFILINM